MLLRLKMAASAPNNQLYEACRQNSANEVLHLLHDKRVDPNSRSSFNNSTCLYVAATENHFQIVKSLLDAGADPNAVDPNGFVSLHSACHRGHVEVVRILLAGCADPDRLTSSGWTPLHYACMEGHLEVVRLLLDSGAKLQVADRHGWTALHSAAFHGSPEVVKLLIKKGANVTARTMKGETPWDLAVQRGHGEKVKVLRGLGDNVVESSAPPFHGSASNPSLSQFGQQLNPPYNPQTQNPGFTSQNQPYNPAFSPQSSQLSQDNMQLAQRNSKLTEQNAKLTEQLAQLVTKCSQLETKNAQFGEELTLLRMRNVRLEDVGVQLQKERNNYARIIEELTTHLPSSSATSSTTNSEKICTICEDRPVNCAILKCGHVYCDECMTRWRASSSRCPNCQQQIEAVLRLFL